MLGLAGLKGRSIYVVYELKFAPISDNFDYLYRINYFGILCPCFLRLKLSCF